MAWGNLKQMSLGSVAGHSSPKLWDARQLWSVAEHACRSEECHSSCRQLENYISEVVVCLAVWSPVDYSGLQGRWVESQKLDYEDANRVGEGTNQRRVVNLAGGEEPQDPQKLGTVTFKPTVCLLRCCSC